MNRLTNILFSCNAGTKSGRTHYAEDRTNLWETNNANGKITCRLAKLENRDRHLREKSSLSHSPGMDEEVSRFKAIFSKSVAKAVFARSTVDNMSKVYNCPGSDIHEQTLLHFQSTMLSLLSKAFQFVLQHSVGKVNANYRTNLVSAAIQSAQIYH